MRRIHGEQSRVEECFVEVYIVLDAGESVVCGQTDISLAGSSFFGASAEPGSLRVSTGPPGPLPAKPVLSYE